MGNAVITVAGKGGVGKTSISAAIVRQLVRDHPEARILAIDADPAVGLATALAVQVKETIDDIRKAITASGEEDKSKKTAIELLGESKFRIFDAMVEQDGFAFLAVGRPEAAGCYCSINSYLKAVISMVSDEFDYVVIDGEAGIEQVNRRGDGAGDPPDPGDRPQQEGHPGDPDHQEGGRRAGDVQGHRRHHQPAQRPPGGPLH